MFATTMKSPNDAFLRMYPCRQVTHDCPDLTQKYAGSPVLYYSWLY